MDNDLLRLSNDFSHKLYRTHIRPCQLKLIHLFTLKTKIKNLCKVVNVLNYNSEISIRNLLYYLEIYLEI